MTTPSNNGQVPVIGGSPDVLCSLGMRPVVLTGFFVDFLRRSFSDESQIAEQDLLAFKWRLGEDSPLKIEEAYKFTPGTTEKRPCVLVKRNAYQNARQTLGDFAGFESRTLGEQFQTTWVGSQTIFCVHGNGASAELLGTEVQRRLTQFEKAITTTLQLKRYQVLQFGELSELEESSQNFIVPVTVGIAYDENWVLRYEAPVLRRIGLRALFGLS